MNRYRFSKENIAAAILFLKKKSATGPPFAEKFKNDLRVKGKKLFYEGKQVVAREEVEDVYRTEIYKVKGDIPAARDAAFHLLKQRYVGCSRRSLMKFLQAQKTLGETRPAVAKAKRSSGEKLKVPTFETDLIFLKRTDCIKADPNFDKLDAEDLPELSYFVSTVEKISGLCRLTPCKLKDESVVTPIVEEHIKDMCKALNVSPSSVHLRSDKGGEFSHKKLGKLVAKTKHVPMGSSVENKNRTAQNKFFRILRSRKAKTIADAMQQSEVLLNQTFNRIHKLTPNEIVKRGSMKENIKEYNDTRKEYQQGDKRKPLEVGTHVRILVKEPKSGLDYKSYNNMTFSEKVYVIGKVTKKTTPRKYWVNKKWRLIDSLLKTQPRDAKSMQLILEREVTEEVKEETAQKKHERKRDEEIKAFEHRRAVQVAQGVRRRTRTGAQRKTRSLIKETLKAEKQAVEASIREKREEAEEKRKEEGIQSVESKRGGVEKKLRKKKTTLADFSVKQLKGWLRKRKQPINGTKEELKQRIKAYLRSGKK